MAFLTNSFNLTTIDFKKRSKIFSLSTMEKEKSKKKSGAANAKVRKKKLLTAVGSSADQKSLLDSFQVSSNFEKNDPTLSVQSSNTTYIVNEDHPSDYSTIKSTGSFLPLLLVASR